jgi:DNA-binding transcriptional ArsR family regulator
MNTINHALLTEAEEIIDRIGETPARVLLQLHGYEQGSRGECRAKVRTIAAKLEREERTVRRALARLRDAGLWERSERRMRWSGRVLTNLGRVCAALLLGTRFTVSPPPVSGHVSPHNGEADPPTGELQNSDCDSGVSANPPIDPRAYQRPRVAQRLSGRTWDALASWMADTTSCSWARCKIAHRTFAGMVMALGRSKEWRAYERTIRGGGDWPVNPEWVVLAAIEDARRAQAVFGTVESAAAYIGAIVQSCVRERRLPGPKKYRE